METSNEKPTSFQNKTLLITGGTGTFGYAVLKRLIKSDIGEIRIFSRDEKKQDDMRHIIQDSRIKYYIGDVRDYNSIVPAMKNSHYVFHAAALKQVPSCEFFPYEAYKTNVLGTENVLNCAIANHAEKVICLSSDKAVYPVNAMGISKAMMEKLMLSRSRTLSSNDPILCATRFGNLLFSRGSVVPVLIGQIEDALPLTLTNPDMTRYLMTVEEAVDLIMFAFEHASQGDIFVKKSPAATIGDLARALLEIFKANNPIKIIGLRHGEKAHETLMTNQDLLHAEDMGDYYRIPVDTRDLNYNQYSTGLQESIHNQNEYDSLHAVRLSVGEIKKKLMELEEMRSILKSKGPES